jgi:hypothetical protein
MVSTRIFGSWLGMALARSLGRCWASWRASPGRPWSASTTYPGLVGTVRSPAIRRT